MIIKIKDYDKSKVLIGERLENAVNYIPKNTQSVVIITDVNVHRIYGNKFPDYPVIIIQTGEKIKTQETVDFIVNKLLNLGADRNTFILGIGGGVVCDITGYVSSIFMRGLDFGYVSTTLLSQVDASIGGKTGINFNGYKNMIGVFSQPQFVLCDVNLLTSLPKEEVKSGLMEIVKHTIINTPAQFDFIVDNLEKILAIDIPILQNLIASSVQIKTTVVMQDEKEKGERKKLNLGHTIGHAIESIEGIPHGYAIAIGLVMAAEVSEKLGFCSKETVNKITNLIASLQMATSTNIETKHIIEAIKKDKKKSMDNIDFIAINNIGDVFIHPISFIELEQKIEAIR